MRQEAEDLTDIIRNGAMLGSGGRLRGLPSSQGIVSVVILVFCGGLVIYPLVYLVAESLNVGEPDVFPPTAFGLSNYLDLIDDWLCSAIPPLLPASPPSWRWPSASFPHGR